MNAVAVETLVKDYKNLVHYVAHRFFNQRRNIRHTHGVDYEDVAQLGFIGLLLAIKNFNKSRGLKFSTYAVSIIDGTIRSYLYQGYFVKIPRSVLSAYYNISKYNLFDKTAEEIAKKLGISIRVAEQALKLKLSTVSMDAPPKYSNDPGHKRTTFGDTLSSGENLEEEIANKDILDRFWNTLKDQEKRVWKLYHIEGKEQSEIAQIVGISQAKVSRLLKKVELKAEEFGRKIGART